MTTVNLGLEKPIYKSLTAWGLLVLGLAPTIAEQACASGLLPNVMCTADAFTRIGLVLSLFGIRRAK